MFVFLLLKILIGNKNMVYLEAASLSLWKFCYNVLFNILSEKKQVQNEDVNSNNKGTQ